ncbi:MAG: sigma-70 family RNA polymerase sigma factor [Fibrobacter sp.]|jgi:RNA polymerase sigma factor (sigma-70 family)|nr:sigma-70 family RNA polymerase sigma factor [Fibrobacter sp.]
MRRDTVEKSECIRVLEDWELVQNLYIEKEFCFSELVRRHYELVVNIGYRFFSDMQLARDNAQEVFLKLYLDHENIKQMEQPFVHWLCRVTSNNCRSLYRKKNSELKAVTGGKVDFWYGEGEHKLDTKNSESIKYVNEALKKINANDRIFLILSHIAELKTNEIAEIEKIPEYTVRRKIKRAEKKLHKLIAQLVLEDYAKA